LIDRGQEQEGGGGRGATPRSSKPRPELTIRDYLDAQGGRVEVPAHNLLTSWRFARFDEAAVAVMTAALEGAGISVEPPLEPGLHEDARVTLQRRPASEQPLRDAGAPIAPERRAAEAARERAAEAPDRLATRRRLGKLHPLPTAPQRPAERPAAQAPPAAAGAPAAPQRPAERPAAQAPPAAAAGASAAPELRTAERPATAEAARERAAEASDRLAADRRRGAAAAQYSPERGAVERGAAARAAPGRVGGAVARLATRRRLGKLRAQYDAQLRTFGGVVFELYRADARRPELIARRVQELHATSAQLAELEQRAGVGAKGAVCRSCGLYCGDGRFCLACGEEVSPPPRRTRMSAPALGIAVLLCTGAWMFGGIRPGGDDDQQVRRASQPTAAQTSQAGGAPAYRNLVAHARRKGEMRIYGRPGGQVSRRLGNPNADGAPLAFLVRRTRGRWMEVYLPARPNGSRGWIRRADVSLSGNDYSVVIDLSRFRLTVRRADRVVARIPIGVGRAVTPTPTGLYYITELLKQPDKSGIYGPWAFGLSAYSNVLKEFAGADGILGVHGTNEPWAIGTSISHGCIRMENRLITRMAKTLPVGTPVRIRRS